MKIKIGNYFVLKTQAPFEGKIAEISANLDINQNDLNDSKILNEVFSGRIDILVSEDKKIHQKAQLLNIGEKVFKIDAFLEKVILKIQSLLTIQSSLSKKCISVR